MDNTLNIQNGILLSNRYEIIDRIGAGGMSDVYLAMDRSLGRQVAVKILKPEFAEDKNFVAKFRAEAQAAAGLEHPNIVNIYDVGTEGTLYYIVMEYVEGITLKTYISKKLKLSYNEALSIAIQVGRGIEAAHNKGIIHRDIKPQNIIISKEGNVKVMDFGIARAATSNTINADIMGSVHYASPEQARNGYVTFTSDIYSLGIVMYEMVTGRVPYDGDTAVAIAIQHLQGEMTPPSAYAPDLPVSVERIIQKATMKNQDRRYQSMSDMLVDLKRSLVNPNEDFVIIPDNGEVTKTRVITEDELSTIQAEAKKIETENAAAAAFAARTAAETAAYNQSPYPEAPSRNQNPYPQRQNAPAQNTGAPQQGYYEEEEDEDEGPVNPKLEKAMTIMGIAAAVVIAIIVIYLVGSALGLFRFAGGGSDKKEDTQTEQTDEQKDGEEGTEGDTVTSGDIEVPSLLGMTYDEAKKAANDRKLGLKNGGEISSDKYEEGKVCQQSINDGTKVAENTTITVMISSGAGDISIPSVTGMEETSAVNMLRDAGFQYKREYTYSRDVSQGKVISQNPSGGAAGSKGDTVTITISQGVELSKVPSVTGAAMEDARAALTSAGFVLGDISEEFSSSVEAGKVIRQSPAANSQADAGTAVNIVVSKGPEETNYSYSFSTTITAVNNEDTTYALTTDQGSIIDTWTVSAAEGTKTISANGINSASGTLAWSTASGTSGSQKVEFTRQ